MNRDDLRERARQRLTYNIPNAARAKLHAAINDVFLTAGKALAEILPVGPDSEAAIDGLGLARMQANAAVSHDPVSEEEADARVLAAIPGGEVDIIDLLSKALGAPVVSMLVATKRWPKANEDPNSRSEHARSLGLVIASVNKSSVDSFTTATWSLRSSSDADAAMANDKVDPWPPALEGAMAAARRHRDRGVSDNATSCDLRDVDPDRVMKPFLGRVVSYVDIDNKMTTIHTVADTGATIARWEGQGSVAEVAERMVEVRGRHGGLFVVDDSYAGRAIVSIAKDRGLDVRSKIDGRVTHTPPASAVDLGVDSTDDVTLSDKTAEKKLKEDPGGLAEARPLMVAVVGATSGGISWSDMLDMTIAEFHALNRDLCEWQEEQLGLCRQGNVTGVDLGHEPDRTVVTKVEIRAGQTDQEAIDQAVGDIADLIEADDLVDNTDTLARWELEERYDKLVQWAKAREAADQHKPELAAMVEDVRHRRGRIILHFDTLNAAVALSPENARKVAGHILGDPSQSYEQAADPGPAALDHARRHVVGFRSDALRLLDKERRSHKAALALWSMLDDIDTLDDRVKDDDVAYRVRARAIQKKREEIMTSDGYRHEYVGEYTLDD